MNLKLAYENELKLIKFPNYRDRIGYITSNILNNNTYMTQEEGKKITFQQYYNMNSLESRTKEQEEQMRNRWLGVKRVGSPYTDDSVKLTIDFLATYLFDCKEYSVRQEIHEFKVLKRRQIRESELKKADRLELDRLEESVVGYSFHKNEVVFYENKKFEKHIKDRANSSNDHVLKKYLEEKLEYCEHLKIKANKINKKIRNFENHIATETKKIKVDYEELKLDRNNTMVFDSISRRIKNLRKTKKTIEELEFDLHFLADEYFQLTELVTSVR